MKITLNDRRGQVWEWLTAPVERYYITKSWLGEHPGNGDPVIFHEMINLGSGELVEKYMEYYSFELLAGGKDPEMTRLL